MIMTLDRWDNVDPEMLSVDFRFCDLCYIIGTRSIFIDWTISLLKYGGAIFIGETARLW